MVLGLLLITFPPKVIEFLGVPAAGHRFYLSIFGGVLVGVGIALLTEYLRKPDGMVGLGLGGAIAINLCGCVVLAVWLASGKLARAQEKQDFPAGSRGQIALAWVERQIGGKCDAWLLLSKIVGGTIEALL
jgi:mannose/fructose/N-acetylgalactosamine-specific phosphotransferase system component IIC